MPPTKNQLAATLTKSEAVREGVLDAPAAVEHITANSKKMYGFTRKMLPQGLPTEPKLYIFSISEYGDDVNLGPGFPIFRVPACPKGQLFGEPCVIEPIHFFEEAKVDVTEHTFHSGEQIVEAILKIGPGMNASWDRRKVGWFVSKTNPPFQAELAQANGIYVAECRRLLSEGERWFRANKLDEINETHRRAADVLGQRVDWDKPTRKMVDCDGCGERIPEGTIKHAVPSCGCIQGVKRDDEGHITDTGMWKRALAANMVKKADIPEEIADLLE